MEFHSGHLEPRDFSLGQFVFDAAIEFLSGELDSIHQIIYIEQNTPYITIYTKNQDNQHWFNDDFDDLDGMVRIDEVDISMKEIYHKVIFTNK